MLENICSLDIEVTVSAAGLMNVNVQDMITKVTYVSLAAVLHY